MAKLNNYEGYTEVGAGLTRYGTTDFPLAEAHDIMVAEDDTRLDEKLAEYDETVAQLKGISSKTYITATITGEYISSEVALHISRIIAEKKTSLSTVSTITASLKKGLLPHVSIPVTGRIGKNLVIAMYYDAAGDWYVRFIPNIIDVTPPLPDYQDVLLSDCITNDFSCSCSCIVLMDTGT
jgi:hypothetical protein